MEKKVLFLLYKNFLIKRESENIEDKIYELKKLIESIDKTNIVSDEVVDFFDILNGKPTRWVAFSKYIKDNYPKEKYKNILDVGCGPFADLSVELNKIGYNLTSIDSRVKQISGLKTIKKLFDYKKEDVSNYDLLLGLEPCDATEHILRSSIENKKECIISLCATMHDSINGEKFSSMKEWYDYLLNITNGNCELKNIKVLQKDFTIIKTKR